MMLSEQERGFGSFVAVAVLGLVFSARPANAQQVKAPLPVDAPERPAVQPEESWIFGLGIGVVSIPKFPGSDSQIERRGFPQAQRAAHRVWWSRPHLGQQPIRTDVFWCRFWPKRAFGTAGVRSERRGYQCERRDRDPLQD